MTGIQVVTLLFLSAGVYCRRLAPLVGAENNPKEVIEGEYIVVLKNHLSTEKVNAHIEYVKKQALMEQQSMDDAYPDDPQDPVVPEEVIMSTYNEDRFKAYAARLSDSLRDSIRSWKEVKYVERNQIVRAEGCASQSNAPWGLARTTSRNFPTTDTYKWDQTGEGVNVYVIDSGIVTNHRDFEGRASWGIDYTKSKSRNTDNYGHGTHVAGTIMSKTYGIAKKAKAIAVRVFDDYGYGTTAQLLSCITYVTNQHTPLNKTIINLSLTLDASKTINDAVNRAVEKGIYVVSAAGNEEKDSCTCSPASATGSITVMASDSTDSFATFSNYGRCAHIIAPGVDILSLYKTTTPDLMSGTSMAAPHVAGVIAKYIGARSLGSLPSPIAMRTILQTEYATENIVENVPSGTTNKLLFYPCI